MDKAYCDICPGEAEMVIEKKFTNHKRYRIRRYTCPICGYSKTIFGDQARDHQQESGAIETINNRYKKEERNRENEKHDKIPMVKRNRPDTTIVLHSRIHKSDNK